MTMTGADRRSVLIGMGALGLIGCAPEAQPDAAVGATALVREPFDLSMLETANGGRLGFAAHDTGSGRILEWRGEERFVYCSTFKMYLAAATLLRVQEGREQLNRAVPISASDLINHAPTTAPAVGGTLTVLELMKGTVELSDNPAANILLKAMGGLEAMQAFYRSLGDAGTRVDRFEPQMNRLDGDKDTILPLQSVANMHRLFIDAATPLSAASKALLLGWMTTTPTGAGRLKAGVPADWRVSHKTGTGGYGPTNDIGVLYPPAGGAPVIVAAYHHAGRASSDAQNEAVIAEAARRALTALGRI